MLVETYANLYTDPPGRQTRRYTVHPEVMVGGEVNGNQDCYQLQRKYNVYGFLNVSGSTDRYWRGTGDDGLEICEVPLLDDGNGFDRDAVREAVSFAMHCRGEGVLYVHCHIGVSRSPAIAYGVLRWVYGMSRTDALLALDGSGGEFGHSYEHYAPKHAVYLASVDRALACV